MSRPTLHYRQVHAPDASPSRWLYVLHGIFGAGRNWASVARRLVGARPDWGAALVDLRLHGGSRDVAPPHTVEAAARDVAELAERTDPADAVLGHSFGGKVALRLVEALDGDLDAAWIVDASPAATRPGGRAWDMLRAVRRLPDRFESRQEAVRALEGEGVATPVARWMATNLESRENAMRWRLDFDAIETLLDDFFPLDLWPIVEDPPGRVHLHFVKALDSSVLPDDACARIQEAGARNRRVRLHRVAGGHWVNADNPDALVALLRRFL